METAGFTTDRILSLKISVYFIAIMIPFVNKTNFTVRLILIYKYHECLQIS